MARSRFTRRLVTTTFLLVVFSLVLNSYLGLFPAYISGVDPSTMSYYDYVMSEAGRDAGSVYSENGVIDTQEYAQAGLALICILWLIIDSRRNRNKGPIVLSEPSFVRGSGSKKDPYILQSPGIITAGGSALSQELITIRQMGGNAVRTVVGPQFDISAIEQPSDEEYSDDGDTMVMRLKVDDRDPDDLDEGVYEFMLSFKILSKIHFLWLVTVDYRKGAKRSTKTPAKTKPQKKIEPRLEPEHNKNKPTEKSAGDDSAKLEAKKRMKAIEIEMEAAEATAAAASIAASESRRKEEEKIRIAEIEAKKRMMAIDAEIEAMLEDEGLTEQEKQKAQWTTVERLVGSKKRLAQVAADLVEHLDKRIEGLPGKAMAVCMSRRICVDLYNEIVALRPDWHSDDDDKGAIKIVMTGSASDPLDWQAHIGNKKRRDDIAKRARKLDDPLKLVIVRDMWLTGFDAPCMHTMYIDKPMRGHGLMQAIARVNRVFKEKPGGLVVDYIGIATNLKKALAQYSQSDRDKTGIDEEEAVALLLEKYEIVRGMFAGHDYSLGVTGKPVERLKALADGIDWILKWQQAEAAKVESAEAKKQAHRRYQDAVLELSKAYALASASDAAAEIRDEVGFFQAVRAALVKTTATGKMTDKAKTLAVEQLLNQVVANAEIVDILKAAGLQSPDISVLSDQFLLDVQQMEKKNLALEALKKLLNGEIKSRSQTNVVQSKAFSRRLEEAVARYHANAISTVEMIQELIALAKEMQAAAARGDELGLSLEEIAFYDALAGNDSAVEAMGSEQLRVIAHELVEQMRGSVTVDWQHKASSRAKMRVLVKRILKRFGYPPDLEQEAVQTVLAQAELLLKEITARP